MKKFRDNFFFSCIELQGIVFLQGPLTKYRSLIELKLRYLVIIKSLTHLTEGKEIRDEAQNITDKKESISFCIKF